MATLKTRGMTVKAKALLHRFNILIRGRGERKGLAYILFRYVLLTAISFVFVYPLLSMLSLSIQPNEDLADFSTRWLPSAFTLTHYDNALEVMNYSVAFLKSLKIVLPSTILQIAVCTVTGYGFARFDFPFKRLWMGVMLLCYLIPSQLTAVPNYLLLNEIKIVNGTILPFLITAGLGQGLNSSLCILIFYMFYKQIPSTLIEAAEIDGAGAARSFFRIALPMVIPGIIIVTVFSIVWYWNDTYLTSTYIGYSNISHTATNTVILQLQEFEGNYAYASIGAVNSIYKFSMAKKAAATMLTIAPLLILYFFVQKKFVKSIDSVGITGE